MTRFSRSFFPALGGLLLIGTSLLTACQTKTPQAAYPLPELSIGVAPFSQPTQSVQLMAGFIPERQGLAPEEDLRVLDGAFMSKLNVTGRSFRELGDEVTRLALADDKQGRRSMLAAWVGHARAAGVDLLIVPQVIDWHERVGGAGGVMTPAAVTVSFFLVDARGEGALLQRSHFQEQQQALADNLLNLGSFVQRRGRWLTAGELVEEGMDRAIREFGLNR